MLNDENACIRYLMKEMDPSEEVLMERAMMEDDDLLIEVESLRQTLRRLDKLPEKTPPAHLTESIVDYASEKAENRSSSHIISFLPLRYAAAAVIVLGLSVGSLWVYQQTNSADSDKAVTKSAETVLPLNVLPVSEIKTEPWVDRENVIYFHDQFNTGGNEFDTILQNSMRKLTPLSNPFQYSSGSRSLQMTGSQKN